MHLFYSLKCPVSIECMIGTHVFCIELEKIYFRRNVLNVK